MDATALGYRPWRTFPHTGSLLGFEKVSSAAAHLLHCVQGQLRQEYVSRPGDSTGWLAHDPLGQPRRSDEREV